MYAVVMQPEQEPNEKRVVTVRVSKKGYDRMIERAARADVPVARMHRWMLAYADRAMPEGWVPSRGGK